MPQSSKSSPQVFKGKKHITGIPDDPNRCTHTDAIGRQCRSLALKVINGEAPGLAPNFCAAHATADRQLREADDIAKYLLAKTPHLDTAASVNYFLEKLVEVVANNRIPVRNATLLTYIGSLLLNSVGQVRNELLAMRGHDAWNKKIFNAFSAIDPHCFDDIIEDIKREMGESGEFDDDSNSEADSDSAENPSADSGGIM
ncbi:MAG: hypothetical protein WAM91_01210 [Candidatus Acidiferrales bacterium]